MSDLAVTDVLCAPGGGLSCFACCPPIRPAGYDHLEHRRSLRRLLLENTLEMRAGQLPQKHMLGFWCPGLGFVGRGQGRVGCLYHPMQNQGRDLRQLTGYQDKCARETCPSMRAFALLSSTARYQLVSLCLGMDSFTFSSPAANPAMRLLGFGPLLAGLLLETGCRALDDLRALKWLASLPPALGWLAHLVALHDPDLAWQAGFAQRVERAAEMVAHFLPPRPPLRQGLALHHLCDEWQARCLVRLSGRTEATPGQVEAWRYLAADAALDAAAE